MACAKIASGVVAVAVAVAVVVVVVVVVAATVEGVGVVVVVASMTVVMVVWHCGAGRRDDEAVPQPALCRSSAAYGPQAERESFQQQIGGAS
jgi:hypothetical protein